MDWYKCGTETGTGTALDIEVGFVPSKFKIHNPVTGASIEWTSEMEDDSGIKNGGDCLLSSAALAIGSSKDEVATGAFNFMIDGMTYAKTADTGGRDITATTCAHSDVHDHYAAFGLQIGADGTMDNGPDAPANNTGYHTEAAAIAALKAVACTSGHVLVGYITVKIDADGADFVGATTLLDAAGYTVTYYNNIPLLLGGITPNNDSNGQGVTLGLDANVNVLAADLYWEAWR